LLRVAKRSPAPVTQQVTSTMNDLVMVACDGRPTAAPATPRQQQHKFSEIIGQALVDGVPISMDARAVYEVQGLV
jgi:hypothetical protein